MIHHYFVKDFFVSFGFFYSAKFYFHFVFPSCISCDEITDKFLYPRFKFGAQSEFSGSNRAAGLLEIERLPQTYNVELFSGRWDAVKSLPLILDNHTSHLCRDNICKFSCGFTMLGRQKNPSVGALLQFIAQPINLQHVTMTFNVRKVMVNQKKIETNFVCFTSFRSIGLSVSLVTATWASRSPD